MRNKRGEREGRLTVYFALFWHQLDDRPFTANLVEAYGPVINPRLAAFKPFHFDHNNDVFGKFTEKVDIDIINFHFNIGHRQAEHITLYGCGNMVMGEHLFNWFIDKLLGLFNISIDINRFKKPKLTSSGDNWR